MTEVVSLIISSIMHYVLGVFQDISISHHPDLIYHGHRFCSKFVHAVARGVESIFGLLLSSGLRFRGLRVKENRKISTLDKNGDTKNLYAVFIK